MSARLRRFVRPRVPSDAETDDIVQDVCQQFTVALDVRPVERVAAWLYTVARNRIIDRYRRPQLESLDALAEGPGERDADAIGAWWLADERTPATELRRQQFWEQLHAALAELPAEQRQVSCPARVRRPLVPANRYAGLHLRRRLQSLRDDMFSRNS